MCHHPHSRSLTVNVFPISFCTTLLLLKASKHIKDSLLEGCPASPCLLQPQQKAVPFSERIAECRAPQLTCHQATLAVNFRPKADMRIKTNLRQEL